MRSRLAATTGNVLIGVAVFAAIAVGVVAALRMDTWGRRRTEIAETYQQELEKLKHIDRALIQYHQTAEIPVGMAEVRAVAAGPDNRIYVAGDQAIRVLAPDGQMLAEIPLDDRPRCVAVGGTQHAFPGRIYAGMKDRVEVYGAGGKREAAWQKLGQKAVLTSIAAGAQDVFVADAGNRVVLRYSLTGELLGRIGRRDPKRNIPGLVIVKPYVDVAVAPDGLLRVVNPRLLRLEAYTFDGDLEFYWGKSSPAIEGFFGCCNPAHFAILPDGRFVTAEKGIARVKIYTAEGKFDCVVAGPRQLAVKGEQVIADLAADSRGRILILDPGSNSLRIFEHNERDSGGRE